jgi:hypothetical protein
VKAQRAGHEGALCGLFASQFFVFEVVRVNEFQHRIAEQVRVLSVVETPRHFVQVGLQMLRRDLMPRSNNAPLKQRKCGLDRIGVKVSVNVLLRTVIHDFVFTFGHRGFPESGRIGGEIISNDDINITRNVLADVLGQRAGLRIFGVEESQIAAALTDADYDFFCLLAVVNTLADLLSAYVGFVYFANAVHLRLCNLFDSMTDAMAEIPCRAVVDFQHPMKLMGTHAFLRLADEVDREEPFRQGQVRVVKHRASGDGELMTAILGIAVVLIAFQDGRNLNAEALRASHAVRPAQMLKVVAALLIVSESFNQLAEVKSIFHRSTHA